MNYNKKQLFQDLGKEESPELRQALMHLYTEIYPKVFGLVMRGKGNEADAKAVMSHGLEILYDKRRCGKLVDDNIYGMLFIICKRKWFGQINAQKSTALVLDDPNSLVMMKLAQEETPIDQALEKEKRAEIIQEELDIMGDPNGEILKDKYFGGLSIRELAVKYSNTEKYMKLKLYRVRNMLKDRLLSRPDFNI